MKRFGITFISRSSKCLDYIGLMMHGKREQTEELIRNMSHQQLQDLYSKYCARDRLLVAYKKFKFYLDVKYVEEQLQAKAIEEILLLPEDNHGQI